MQLPIALPRVIAALVSGALFAVLSPPLNLHYLHWFAFLPLLWALRRDTPADNAVLGWICGFTGVASCFFWISESIVRFSNVHPFLAFQVAFLFGFGFSLPYILVFWSVHKLRDRFGLWWVALLPALQVATEFVMGELALFPYYHGVSQYRFEPTWQLASVLGVTGVTFLIFLTNCALAEIVYRKREGGAFPVAPVAAAAGLFVANFAFGTWRSAAVAEEVATWPTARMSQLQLAITMEERMSASARKAMQDWVRVTQDLRGEKLDLLIWPEGATPYDPRQLRVTDLMASIAEGMETPILFGGGFAERRKDPETGRDYIEQRNSMYLMNEAGELTQRYDKMVPLPFGEYIPLSDTFPFLKDIVQGPGDFERGTEPVLFEGTTTSGEPFSFTSPICYEAILSRFFRNNLADTDLLVNVTNDGWFGDTAAPHQHAMLSAVRSVETGVPMYRIAYTGISMLILPNGEILHETEPFTRVARVIEVPVGRVSTVYMQIGDVFSWLCLLSIIGAAVVGRRVTPDAAAS